MYGPAADEDGEIVDEEFLEKQTPGYQKPWRGDLEAGEESQNLTSIIYSKKRRRTFIKRLQVCIQHSIQEYMLILN